MKSSIKYLVALITLILLDFSCQLSEKSAPQFSRNSMDVQPIDRIAIVKQQFIERLWNDQHFDMASAIFTDDFYTESMSFEPSNWIEMHGKGAASMVHHIQWWLEIIPDAHVAVIDVAAVENRVIINWELTGTMKGQLLGQLPKNQALKILGSTTSYFEGKKIKKNKTILDKYGLLQQIGVL